MSDFSSSQEATNFTREISQRLAMGVGEGFANHVNLSLQWRAGYPQYELVKGGSDIIVDTHNVGEYIDAVVNATMHEGIAAQMQAFRCAISGTCKLPAHHYKQ